MKNEWKNVGEMPKAGKPVLVSTGKLVLKACWIPQYFQEDDGDYLGDPEYCDEKDQYYWPGGWYEWNYYEDTHFRIDDEIVTHWMELPQLP